MYEIEHYRELLLRLYRVATDPDFAIIYAETDSYDDLFEEIEEILGLDE